MPLATALTLQPENPRRFRFQRRAGAAGISTLAKVTRNSPAADMEANPSIADLKSLAEMIVPFSGEGAALPETPLAVSAAIIKQIVA
jgi:hypothetical protein